MYCKTLPTNVARAALPPKQIHFFPAVDFCELRNIGPDQCVQLREGEKTFLVLNKGITGQFLDILQQLASLNLIFV